MNRIEHYISVLEKGQEELKQLYLENPAALLQAMRDEVVLSVNGSIGENSVEQYYKFRDVEDKLTDIAETLRGIFILLAFNFAVTFIALLGVIAR